MHACDSIKYSENTTLQYDFLKPRYIVLNCLIFRRSNRVVNLFCCCGFIFLARRCVYILYFIALLRPGRFEVQIEIPPPKTTEQRVSIFKIHTKNMLAAGRLQVNDPPSGTTAERLLLLKVCYVRYVRVK